MSNDKIKIVEFGMDNDDPKPPWSEGGRAMKIIEFDNDRNDGEKRAATAKDVGHIKIIEFDEGPKGKRPPPPAKPSAKVGPVKVKEFGEEGKVEARASSGGAPKMRIMEFD